jgi:hypothetical protein
VTYAWALQVATTQWHTLALFVALHQLACRRRHVAIPHPQKLCRRVPCSGMAGFVPGKRKADSFYEIIKQKKMVPNQFRYQQLCLRAVFLIGFAIALCAADSSNPDFVLDSAQEVASDDADIDFLSESPSVPDDATLDAELAETRGEVRELWTKAKAVFKNAVTKDAEFKLPGSVLASWRDSGCRVARQKSGSCTDDCNYVVNTLQAKVNRFTQNHLVDIAASLQDAIERASVAAKRRGLPSCTVTLPKGQYTISKTISVPSRVHVMGNSATITLPKRSTHFDKYFPAFEFRGEEIAKTSTADVPLFTFSTPPSKPIGPGKQINLPSDVASAAANLLARKERVVLRAYVLGVPDMQQFRDTQHKTFYENYAAVVDVDGWAKDPVGFLVEVLSVSPSNVAQLRSSLPFEFRALPFALQLIPASKFVTNSALTDLFLIRPPVSPSDIQIIQANSCDEESEQCKAIKAAYGDMSLGSSAMVVLRFTLDVQIARNSMTGILRSGTWMDNTLHACFHSNIVTNAHLFGDSGSGFGNGVTISEYSSYNAVIKNSFSTLRHAMLLQYGANSNVIANNKNDKVRCQICRPSSMSDASARKKVADLCGLLEKASFGLLSRFNITAPVEYSWGKVILHDLALNTSEPAVSTACANLQHEDSSQEFSLLGQNIDWCADVSFHGLFSNNNLIEGNDVETIKIADFYGPSPSNVVFGNRINSGTLSVVVDRASTDTMLVDNLFTRGGISFLDDASSAICIDNKRCLWGTGKSCAVKQQPEISEFSLFAAPCSLIKIFSSTLSSYTKAHPKGLGQFVKWIADSCAYWDRNTGGKANKFECMSDNIISVKARPQSLFADKTLKACTDMKPECFDRMQGPDPKRFCDVKSPSSSPTIDSSSAKTDFNLGDDDHDFDADLDDDHDIDDDVDVDLDTVEELDDEAF